MSNNDPTASTSSLKAPTTPETPHLALPHPTPTVHKQSSNIPYTSGHILRDENLIALGQEMVGYVVGPMPSKEFLAFLPSNPLTAPVITKKTFADVTKQPTEVAMYDPFINAMEVFCPALQGINTSAMSMKIFSGNVIKPDIIYYNSSRSNPERVDVESAELMVEAKVEKLDDPFKDDGGLLRNSDRARQTLGQLTNYATAHLAAQFRTHVFSVLLFRDSARLMRWDRAGLIVSQLISQSVLANFFWRFSNANAEQRGHDSTVTPFIFTKDLTKDFLFAQLQFAADPGDVKKEDINFFEVLLPRENNRYVIGKATYLGLSSLASRATRSFKAWCLKTKRPVFLKDTWRIVVGSQRPEHDIYNKLSAANVQHIATVLDHSDIEGHLTATGNHVKKSWVCKSGLKPFRTLQHYRLVLREIGCSLTLFSDFRQVLAAMRDALQAHREAYYNGHVLHRDISPGNILIYNGGGLLIDWDMSKDLEWESDDKNISRSGTWAFQSLRLSQLPSSDQPQVVQDRLDDLESFYHVLFWVSLLHARHGRAPSQLYDDLTRLFDHAVFVDDKPCSNAQKFMHMTSTSMLQLSKFQNRPLCRLLLEISGNFTPLYIPPPQPSKIPNRSEIKKSQRTEESYERALEIYKEDLNFLNVKENSNWMELSIQDALQQSEDEWGPTSHIINRLASSVTDPQTKRRFSDMTTSVLRFTQGGDFNQIMEGDEDQDAGEVFDENVGEETDD